MILIFGWGLGAGMAAGGVAFLVASAPWRAFGVIVVLILVPLGLGLCGVATVAALGPTRVRLDATVLELARRLGPARVRCVLVPLSRLLEVGCRADLNDVNLMLQTALARHEFGIPLLRGEGRVATLEILEALRERVEALGRGVRWSSSDETPGQSDRVRRGKRRA